MRIEHAPALIRPRWDGADFVVMTTQADLSAVKTGFYANWDGDRDRVRFEFGLDDVLTACCHWGPLDGLGPDFVNFDSAFEDELRELAKRWLGRICVSNEHGELTCRNAVGPWHDCMNSEAMRSFAEQAFSIVGDRLVLSPIPYDLCQDVKCGAGLMRWCAERNVPLLMYCGFWFLLTDAEKRMNKSWDKYIPMAFVGKSGWIFERPFTEISDAIKETGVEAWSGVGWVDGLRLGMVRRLEDFGFKGVMTSRAHWNEWGKDE